MKKMILKILVLVFISVMTFAFSSCGKDETSKQKKEPQKLSEIELPIIE